MSPIPDLGKTLTNTTMLLKVVPPLSFQFQIFLLATSAQTQPSLFISSYSFEFFEPTLVFLRLQAAEEQKEYLFMAVSFPRPLPTVHTQTALAYHRSFEKCMFAYLFKVVFFSLPSKYSGLFCAEFFAPSELRTPKVISSKNLRKIYFQNQRQPCLKHHPKEGTQAGLTQPIIFYRQCDEHSGKTPLVCRQFQSYKILETGRTSGVLLPNLFNWYGEETGPERRK